MKFLVSFFSMSDSKIAVTVEANSADEAKKIVIAKYAEIIDRMAGITVSKIG